MIFHIYNLLHTYLAFVMTTINRKNILFLCTGNSARSQLAHALLMHRANAFYNVYSAGTHPEVIDPRAIKALSDLNIDTHALYAKSLSEYSDMHFDTVITLCEEAQALCRNYEQSNQQLAWHLTDPKSRSQNYAFERTLQEIDDLISLFLVAELPANLLPECAASLHTEHSLDIAPNEFYKCLTDDIRLKALMLTHYHGELCVCELMAALDEESQPKLSRNLAVLKKSQIIIGRKHGQWMFYRINPALPQWIKTVIAQTTRHNISLISDSIQTLKTMDNRPSKNKFCG